ncbi:hypothetical protein B0H14DRAFT_3733864 [Mycena olivaceomarginata]|nr:hypothetical protein B0H14DRAFT_3733864 [Mycena olivaceomarginata]
MMVFDPSRRPTAAELLRDLYFLQAGPSHDGHGSSELPDASTDGWMGGWVLIKCAGYAEDVNAAPKPRRPGGWAAIETRYPGIGLGEYSPGDANAKAKVVKPRRPDERAAILQKSRSRSRYSKRSGSKDSVWLPVGEGACDIRLSQDINSNGDFSGYRRALERQHIDMKRVPRSCKCPEELFEGCEDLNCIDSRRAQGIYCAGVVLALQGTALPRVLFKPFKMSLPAKHRLPRTPENSIESLVNGWNGMEHKKRLALFEVADRRLQHSSL